jgi:demethylmenaquinone methyltransferase/2-methoxy-6-polyprenyl-1,4-benzoquinol methylase
MKKNSQQTTDFGYQDIPVTEKTEKVAEVFHSVASKYDLMNDLMSGGIHRLWKRYAIELCAIRPGHTVLDLAGGTGDLTLRLASLVSKNGFVILGDINESMLKIGRDRLIDHGYLQQFGIALLNAENLPFPENTFDCITIAFGLRNVTDKQAALVAMYQSLKPGGRCIILEFSKPAPTLQKIYDVYSFKILPLLGKIVANDAESYRYLAESIRRHPDQETLKKMLEQAGFENVEYHNLSAGIVAVHRGYKF